MKAIITALESLAPTWPTIAEATARPPYILYSESETPIITFDGIAGYESTLEVTVVEHSKIAANTLKERVVNSLNGITFNGYTLYYDGARYVDYPDESLASYELTFNIEK